MRIDLHTHSSVSDGTDSPEALVRHAAEAGLDVVALTDHDTCAGWQAATAAAAEAGVVVVPGIELSTTLEGTGAHLLGYLPDPTYAPLAAELARIRSSRVQRLKAISERLAALGVPVRLDDVYAAASRAVTVGRPHVADALVTNGYVRDRNEAFERWLGEGRPAFVRKYSPDPAAGIALLTAAGGAVVLAHPWGRGSRRVLVPETLAELAAAGLSGLEVDHGDHDEAARRELRRLARELDLVVTGSSDYHGAGKTGHRLGAETTDPEQYERLLERAAAAAQRAGRPAAPRPVGGRRA